LSCSIWFSAPSFWIGGGLESCCVGRVYGADGAVRMVPCGWCHNPHRTHKRWKPMTTRQIGRPKPRWEGDVLGDTQSMNIGNWKEVVEHPRTLYRL
jgi:hypothetical protein